MSPAKNKARLCSKGYHVRLGFLCAECPTLDSKKPCPDQALLADLKLRIELGCVMCEGAGSIGGDWHNQPCGACRGSGEDVDALDRLERFSKDAKRARDDRLGKSQAKGEAPPT